MNEHCVFFRTKHPPLKLPPSAKLSAILTVENSPVLFGCRTGICGTCLAEVEVTGGGELPPPGAEETELLALLAPGNPKARLTCQLDLRADVRIHPLRS